MSVKNGIVFFIITFLLGCQTTGEKKFKRVESLALAFRPLESSIHKTCEVDVELSGPTEEKYRQSFPEEKISPLPVTYEWSISGRRCSLTPKTPSKEQWLKNHMVVVKAALCTLVQGFVIESPFAGLNLLPADVQEAGDWTQILGSQSRKPVLEVHDTEVRLKATATQGQVFQADYEMQKQKPIIETVRMENPDYHLIVEEFQFQDYAAGEVKSVNPREIQSFAIKTKDSLSIDAYLYARASVTQCY